MSLRSYNVVCASFTWRGACKGTLHVGTDCSGLEAPLLALRRLAVPFRHRFASEINSCARRVLLANFAPDYLYHDVTMRSVRRVPKVDLYIAGFPCQPFSSSGSKGGFLDFEGRGTIFREIFAYIKHHRPRCFVLENVVDSTRLSILNNISQTTDTAT
jgi:site-specific DNA-cytosine methylase